MVTKNGSRTRDIALYQDAVRHIRREGVAVSTMHGGSVAKQKQFKCNHPEYSLAIDQDMARRIMRRERIHNRFLAIDGNDAAWYAITMERVFYEPHRRNEV